MNEKQNSLLQQLRELSTIVADSCDVELIQNYRPRDATTNPTLLLHAARLDKYRTLAEDALRYANVSQECSKEEALIEKLSVNFASEILNMIKGRVSIEINSKWSFDTKKTIQSGERLIRLLEKQGCDSARVLLKIAATWEGVRAAEHLQNMGVNCNLTLIFSMPQVIACAEAGVKLISPFVGRISDWHQQQNQQNPTKKDPGVQFVHEVFHYLKGHDYPTEIMAASFRNINQILQLSGCDLLTISPDLLSQLESEKGTVNTQLDSKRIEPLARIKQPLKEQEYHNQLQLNLMATTKLSEGITRFNQDTNQLTDHMLNPSF